MHAVYNLRLNHLIFVFYTKRYVCSNLQYSCKFLWGFFLPSALDPLPVRSVLPVFRSQLKTWSSGAIWPGNCHGSRVQLCRVFCRLRVFIRWKRQQLTDGTGPGKSAGWSAFNYACQLFRRCFVSSGIGETLRHSSHKSVSIAGPGQDIDCGLWQTEVSEIKDKLGHCGWLALELEKG